ncbi:MAG: carbohydrate kinase family protein, partial [Firmicutes bacterium]|nr:carbohydrate kinase family protein [Bacillota bacterium]
IRQETRQAGVNLASSLSVPGGRSGIYMALLEEDGDLALAVADMAVIDHLTPEYLRGKADLFRNSRLIVADANLREEALDTLTEMARRAEVPILVEPVSIQKAERLKSLLADVDYVTPNGEELEALTGRVIRSDEELGEAAAWLLDRGLKAVLVTLGPRGLYLATPQVSRFLPPYPGEVADATGAGDALTAGFVYGLYQGFELEEAARYGLAAASLTISSPETVNPRMSEEAVKQLINKEKAPGGVTG